MFKKTWMHLVFVWLAFLKLATLQTKEENICELFRNISRLQDDEEAWWERNRNLAKSILETKIWYSDLEPSCKKFVDSLRELQSRGDALTSSSSWAQKLDYLNASSEEYKAGPCVEKPGYYTFISSSILDKMNEDSLELRGNVNDKREYNNFITQIATKDGFMDALSGISVHLLEYLTRFQRCNLTIFLKDNLKP
ncbi:uncharacterized protein LOC108106065 [Drosophila eugracilis]|uniref:uncharacterized protein LOC108106065 n=1 Tax=Drosophila eugracilis TaxID=29029 RepID=UPI001BDB21A4|nr:uncharacterized protein LOC108106065 [Drosophila eugracilis]